MAKRRRNAPRDYPRTARLNELLREIIALNLVAHLCERGNAARNALLEADQVHAEAGLHRAVPAADRRVGKRVGEVRTEYATDLAGRDIGHCRGHQGTAQRFGFCARGERRTGCCNGTGPFVVETAGVVIHLLHGEDRIDPIPLRMFLEPALQFGFVGRFD